MRRLPVINSTAPEDDAAAARPRWQWILIGMGFTGAFWIPVALLVGPLGVPLAEGLVSRLFSVQVLGNPSLGLLERGVLGVLSAVPLIVTYALAAAGMGAVMGRFATRSPPGDAAWAAASSAAGLAVMSAPSSALLALLAFVGLAPAGALAAFLASRRMRPAVPRGGST
jgi:hypothetical protein